MIEACGIEKPPEAAVAFLFPLQFGLFFFR